MNGILIANFDNYSIIEYTDPDNNNSKAYYIKNGIVSVGMITANFDESGDEYGNIGYIIGKKYQGHNMAFNVLELIANRLYECGMVTAVICMKSDNIPSKKVAIKFGAKYMGTFETDKGQIDRYELDLREKLGIRENKKTH